MAAFIHPTTTEPTMPRKTIHMQEDVVQTVRDCAREEESFSATVSRLIEAGARIQRGKKPPEFIGAAEGGPTDLGRRAETYLENPVTIR